MTDNPVKNVRKPTIVRDHVVRVLTPREVEALRAEMDLRDATIISCLAYSGPRPGELIQAPLNWQDVQERSLLYRQPKTQRPPRAVRMIAPLAGDLAAWRLACGGPTKGPVFPDTAGTAWNRDQWKNWHRRHFLPPARALGRGHLTPLRPTPHLGVPSHSRGAPDPDRGGSPDGPLGADAAGQLRARDRRTVGSTPPRRGPDSRGASTPERPHKRLRTSP